MNLLFQSKEADTKFFEAAEKSESVRNWLIQRLSGYAHVPEDTVVELTIGLDFGDQMKKEFADFMWCITTVDRHQYNMGNTTDNKLVMNGGLIYRGEMDGKPHCYSSHT